MRLDGVLDAASLELAIRDCKERGLADYGANAKPAPDEAVKANLVVVTSFEPDVEVPPFTRIGKNQEIVRIPDFFVTPPQGRYTQKNAEVICMFSSTNSESSIPSIRPNPPSVMVMYPNPKIIHDPNDIHYAYHATQNPDEILLGVSSVLIHCWNKSRKPVW